MNKLIFKIKGVDDSIVISQKNSDFINTINAGNYIRFEGKMFVVEKIDIDRNIEHTHPMIDPPGFYFVVSMTVNISEVE